LKATPSSTIRKQWSNRKLASRAFARRMRAGSIINEIWLAVDTPVDIKDEVKRVIASQLKVPVERMKPDVRLMDLGAESLDFVEVLFELEEKFDISIPFNANKPKAELGDESTLLTSTVDELAEVIARMVAQKRS